MKHKAISRIFAVLLAALILTGGLSVTAYAGGGEETPTLHTILTAWTPAIR